MKIAVSGKGGVGKTTVSANLAKLLNREQYNVLAVDADPDSSLGLALGIGEERLAAMKPIIEMRDLIGEKWETARFTASIPFLAGRRINTAST